MTVDKFVPFALAPADMGCRNHILGAFRAIAELTKQKIDLEKFIIIPDGSTHFAGPVLYHIDSYGAYLYELC